MQLTKQSEMNIRFILNHYSSLFSITPSKHTYMKRFYRELKKAEEYVKNLSKNISVKEVKHVSDIKKSNNYQSSFFPSHIQNYIESNCMYYLVVTLHIQSRTFTIYFYLCKKQENLDMFQKYVDIMAMWLYMASSHSSSMCAETLSIYIYLSPFQKEIPKSSVETMGVDHVNTAFTTSCTKNGEIVIYRQEEWFKVFIHETFHVFGLDFSNVNSTSQKNLMRDIFPIQSEFNIEESYCEFWARTLNVMFFSYDNFHSYKEFKMCFDINMELEKIHSMIQLNKVLKFMGLTYQHLCDSSLQHICKKLYKENSNVFAYYILTCILLNNLNDTIQWCSRNNIMIFRFKQTPANLTNYVQYIKEKYKKKKFVQYTSKIKQLNTQSMVMSAIEYA